MMRQIIFQIFTNKASVNKKRQTTLYSFFQYLLLFLPLYLGMAFHAKAARVPGNLGKVLVLFHRARQALHNMGMAKQIQPMDIKTANDIVEQAQMLQMIIEFSSSPGTKQIDMEYREHRLDFLINRLEDRHLSSQEAQSKPNQHGRKIRSLQRKLDKQIIQFYLNKAKDQAKQGQYEEALANIDRAIELDRKSSEPYFIRSNIQFELGQYEEALKDINQAVKLDGKLSKLYFMRSNIQFVLGQYEEALADINQAIELDSGPPKKPYLQRFIRRDVFRQALAGIERAIESGMKEGPLVYFTRASLMEKLMRLHEALVNVNQAIELNGENSQFYFLRARINYHLGSHLKQALADINRAIELNDKSPKLYYLRSNINRDLNKPEEALKDINQAIEANNKEPEFYYGRARIRFELGQYEEALKDINQAIKLNSRFAKLYYLRSNINRDLNRPEKALADINRAIKLDGENPIWYSMRARIKHHLGQYEEALSDTTEGVTLDDEFPHFYYIEAKIQLQLNRFYEASASIDQAAELDGEFSDLYYDQNLRYIQSRADRHEEALAHIYRYSVIEENLYSREDSNIKRILEIQAQAVADVNRAVESGLTDAHIFYLTRAVLKMSLGRYEEALEDINQVVVLDSENPESYFIQAGIYYALDNNEGFLNSIKKAVKLDNENPESYWLWSRVDRFERALNWINELERDVQLDGQDMDYHFYSIMAILKMRLNRNEEALDDINQAIELNPLDTDLYHVRSNIYLNLGRHQEALDDIEVAVNNSNHPQQ